MAHMNRIIHLMTDDEDDFVSSSQDSAPAAWGPHVSSSGASSAPAPPAPAGKASKGKARAKPKAKTAPAKPTKESKKVKKTTSAATTTTTTANATSGVKPKSKAKASAKTTGSKAKASGEKGKATTKPKAKKSAAKASGASAAPRPTGMLSVIELCNSSDTEDDDERMPQRSISSLNAAHDDSFSADDEDTASFIGSENGSTKAAPKKRAKKSVAPDNGQDVDEGWSDHNRWYCNICKVRVCAGA
ncbi:hypothetical protein PINS_up015065 [Pythium insidiosum]|nr:hypothetical protein PINS_up015065 [Pythium insidiosum]